MQHIRDCVIPEICVAILLARAVNLEKLQNLDPEVVNLPKMSARLNNGPQYGLFTAYSC